jgi:hypothetical protein
MKDAFIIAAVTAILKHQLENGLVSHQVPAYIGGEALVSALSPDRIPVGSDERPQLNVFLHQVMPHTSLSASSRLTASERALRQRATASLGVDLSYMVTAYGAQDFQIDVLLGYALHLLQAMPVIPADTVRAVLQSLSLDNGHVVSPALIALTESNVARRIEQIDLCPRFLNGEEMSKLWSALQARYRPSLAYNVSVHLHEET